MNLDRLRIRLSRIDTGMPWLALLAVLTGLLAGAVIVAFRLLVEGAQGLFLPGGDAENYEALDPWLRLLLPVAGGLLLGLIFQALPAEARGVGVVYVHRQRPLGGPGRAGGAPGRHPGQPRRPAPRPAPQRHPHPRRLRRRRGHRRRLRHPPGRRHLRHGGNPSGIHHRRFPAGDPRLGERHSWRRPPASVASAPGGCACPWPGWPRAWWPWRCPRSWGSATTPWTPPSPDASPSPPSSSSPPASCWPPPWAWAWACPAASSVPR